MEAPVHTPAPQAPAAAQRLPTCIPLSYTDAKGVHWLTYPRSPYNPARYIAVPMRQGLPDLECVHDDMGNLVPVRQRDTDVSMFWRVLP
jgi:hypothetical protein